MQNSDFFLLQELYINHLKTLEDIHFTSREIDVMACLLNARGTSRIASLLAISSHTVVTHVRKIMSKLGCSSREGIIDFIENSHALALFKIYYLNLVIFRNFEKSLEEISKLKKKSNFTCLLVYGDYQKTQRTFFQYLENHLKQAGLKIVIQKQNLPDTIPALLSDEIILLFLNKKNTHEISKKLTAFESIELEEDFNYYFFVFSIFQKLFSCEILEPILSAFKKTYESICQGAEPIPFRQKQLVINEKFNFSQSLSTKAVKQIWNQRLRILKNKVISSGLAFSLIGICLFFYFNYLSHNILIRSDLILPTESTLLERPELLIQIDHQLKEQQNIKAVALVGPGGAGKTTLARQYAHLHKGRIIWEMNAETKESLSFSFERFAQAFAKTEDDKKILKKILDLEDFNEKENKIISFIKEHLRIYPNWLLIFDNVDSFTDVQKYFPYDAKTWGQGIVILTTRNSTLQNNKSVGSAIQVGELTPYQKNTLFTKIIRHGNEYNSKLHEIEGAKQFLEKIPPYPLDVSMAAYYIKATDTPYSRYLESVTQNNKDFVSFQETLLREFGDYTKTRYGIIILSLQRFINTHKDFEELLLFIGLLDSQNIPRDLLDKYKGNEIVDNFIYHLKKYSLVATKPLSSSSLESGFSIHRSTQEIILKYLIQKLTLEQKLHLVSPISNVLEDYIIRIIEKEDFSKMKYFILHINAFLNHNNLLTNSDNSAIRARLGCIYYYTHFHENAKKLLEQSIMELRHTPSQKNYSRTAQALAYLGNVHKEVGNHERAKNLLEESIELYKRHDPNNHIGIARALTYLGDTHKNLGNHEKARDLLEESLAISKKYFCENHIELARTMLHLGIVYRDIGHYEKAITLLRNSLRLFNKYSPENYIGLARALKYLGNVYRSLGRYEEAKDLLEQSLTICEKYLPDNQIALGRSLVHLANIYKSLGDYEKAISLLNKSLEIHKKLFGADSVRTYWVITHLGNIYRELGDCEKAKLLIEQSLKMYMKSYNGNNLRAVWVSMQLGYVHEDLENYTQAKEILEKALAIHKSHFNENHVKNAVIFFHLGNIYRGLGQYEKAKKFLEKSLIIYERHYGKEHVETARVLGGLGKVYLDEGKLEIAEAIMKRALGIYQRKKHPGIFFIFENLAELHFQKAKEEKNKGHIEQAQTFKAQAIDELNEALEIVKTHFPKNSLHIKRIQETLQHNQL